MRFFFFSLKSPKVASIDAAPPWYLRKGKGESIRMRTRERLHGLIYRSNRSLFLSRRSSSLTRSLNRYRLVIAFRYLNIATLCRFIVGATRACRFFFMYTCFVPSSSSIVTSDVIRFVVCFNVICYFFFLFCFFFVSEF